jgi:chromosome partitioning protein
MILSIASQKGGTGKTSTSISLAAGLARRGKKVLLVDIDSQANSSKVLMGEQYKHLTKDDTVYSTILERKPLVVHPSGLDGLDVVPSHILLSETDVVLTTALDHREARLKRQLSEISEQYDFVIIDCPPALSWLTINAFTASDGVVVVVSPGYFELDSVVQIQKTLEQVRDNFNPSLKLSGFLFTMSDATVNSKTSLQVLRQTCTDRVFRTIIPRNTDMRDAHMTQQDIFGYNANASAANAYSKFIAEMFGL